jgi:hypothetical protein
MWSARFGEGAGTDVPVTAIDQQASVVEVPLERAGRYEITARAPISGSTCAATAIAFAQNTASRLGQFRVRITPPPGPFPVQEIAVQANAGTPLVQALALQRGQAVILEPQDETGMRNIPSYVRVTQQRVPLVFEGHTARGQFRPQLLAPFSYDLLFVPDDEVAPFATSGLTPSMLNVLPQRLSPGAVLTGKLNGPGAPLRDGRVILRAGPLTSTVGASSAAGDFSLRVRAGQFAVAVAPPPAAGLPELTTPPEGGLVIVDGNAAGSLEVSWAPVSAANVSLVVRASDGLAMAAGARVWLERVAPLAAAGTLIHRPPSGPPVMRTLTGQVRSTGLVSAAGTVDLPAMPPGQYRLLVAPADADTASALSTIMLDVPAGGLSGRMVQLSSRVKLLGTLRGGEPGVTRIHATSQMADPPRPVASAVVGAGGAYELEVDPDRSYVVWADPGVGRPFARVQLARLSAGSAGVQVPERALPRALAFTGTVTGGGASVPGAVIQVFCDGAASAACLDGTLPLAEGTSGADGRFTLGLPDPGSF